MPQKEQVIRLNNYDPQLASWHYRDALSLRDYQEKGKNGFDTYSSNLPSMYFTIKHQDVNIRDLRFNKIDETEPGPFLNRYETGQLPEIIAPDEMPTEVLSGLFAIFLFILTEAELNQLKDDIEKLRYRDPEYKDDSDIMSLQALQQDDIFAVQTEQDREEIAAKLEEAKKNYGPRKEAKITTLFKNLYHSRKSEITLLYKHAIQGFEHSKSLGNAFAIGTALVPLFSEILNPYGYNMILSATGYKVVIDLDKKIIAAQIESGTRTLVDSGGNMFRDSKDKLIQDYDALIKNTPIYPLFQGQATFTFEISFDENNPDKFNAKFTEIKFLDASEEYRALVIMSLFFGKEFFAPLEEKAINNDMGKITRFLQAESLTRKILSAMDNPILDYEDPVIREKILLSYQYTKKKMAYSLSRLTSSYFFSDAEINAQHAINTLETLAIEKKNTAALNLAINAKKIFILNTESETYQQVTRLCQSGENYLRTPEEENVKFPKKIESPFAALLAEMENNLRQIYAKPKTYINIIDEAEEEEIDPDNLENQTVTARDEERVETASPDVKAFTNEKGDMENSNTGNDNDNAQETETTEVVFSKESNLSTVKNDAFSTLSMALNPTKDPFEESDHSHYSDDTSTESTSRRTFSNASSDPENDSILAQDILPMHFNLPDPIKNNDIFIQAVKASTSSDTNFSSISIHEQWKDVLSNIYLTASVENQEKLISLLKDHKLDLLKKTIDSLENNTLAQKSIKVYDHLNQKTIPDNPVDFIQFWTECYALEAHLANCSTSHTGESPLHEQVIQSAQTLQKIARYSNNDTALLITGVVAVSLITVGVIAALSFFCPPVGVGLGLGLAASFGVQLGIISAAGITTAALGAGALNFSYKKMAARSLGPTTGEAILHRNILPGPRRAATAPIDIPNPRPDSAALVPSSPSAKEGFRGMRKGSSSKS